MEKSKSEEVQDQKARRLKADEDTLRMFPQYPAFHRKNLKFDPPGFAVESEKLEQKLVDSSVQWRSLQNWEHNPKRAMNYFVCGSPDDEKALYFAAYLASVHRLRLGVNADIHWEPVFNGWENPIVKPTSGINPSLLILSNLSTKSNYLKYDKARDCIERFAAIPKIIVCAGEDPISFAATRLHVACHGLAYFGSTLNKQYSEVI